MIAKASRWLPLALTAWAACGCATVGPPCVDCRPPRVEAPADTPSQRPSRRSQVRLVSAEEPLAGTRAAVPRDLNHTSAEPEYSIDLPTALRLADAGNPVVAGAREQIRQALAKVAEADVLWLPAIRPGVNYNRHDGAIQAVDGSQFNTSRAAFYSGLGGGTFGAGVPLMPGVYANFALADAVFQPLAARQFAYSRRKAADAVTNDTLLSVAQTYLELLRAGQDMAIAREIAEHTERVAALTSEYAQTGQGLQSDADRLQVERTVRQNDVLRADEARQVAATRLAQLLHLDPTIELSPVEPLVVPVDLVPPEAELRSLVAEGLSARPELAESRCLVTEAVARLRRERFAPLMPSVLLGTSYGAMGAGFSGSLAPATARLDVDAIAYWQLRGLGLGDRAAQDDARSVVRQAHLRQVSAMDQVAREITEAYSQSQARRRQIAIAREGVRAALNSYRRNLERIEHAKGLPIEVLQSVQALALARREYLRTLIDYNLAQFSLYRALGWPADKPGR